MNNQSVDTFGNALAIILAAGRGSRMYGLTNDKPKCLLKLAGKTLLDWQLKSLREAGFKNILLVRGYQAHLLHGDYDVIDNARWAETNMVQSLLSAIPKISHSQILIAYGDIVYNAKHVKKLMKCQGDICLSYDKDWQSLWQLRAENTTDNILADAENFMEEKGELLRIGSHATTLDDVHGQYMGLLKFTPKGLESVQKYVATLATLTKEKADKLDMTSLLSALLEEKQKIHAVPVYGAWCECDTEADIKKYETALAKGKWKHDWR